VGDVVYIEEFRKKREEHLKRKRFLIDEFIHMLESSNWSGDDDYDFSESIDTITYTLTIDDETIDFDE